MGAGGSGDEHDAVAQIDDLAELRGEIERGEIGNHVGDHAHHDGASAALAKHIHAEAGELRHAVGKIGGAFLFEFAGGEFAAFHQIVGDALHGRGGELADAGNLHFDQLAAAFDLRGAARRKNQIAGAVKRLEHRGDNFGSAGQRGSCRVLRSRGRRRCGRWPR